MAFVTPDRIKETATGTGTGNLALQGAFGDAFLGFADRMSIGDTTYIVIRDGDAWELTGATLVGSTELRRDTVIDSSDSVSGSAPVKISLSSGTHTVFVAPIGAKTLITDSSGGLANASPLRQTIFVETHAEMKALSVSDGDAVYAMGASAIGDGAGGLFYFDADDATSADNVDTFRNDNSATGLHKRVRDRAIAIQTIEPRSGASTVRLYTEAPGANPNDYFDVEAREAAYGGGSDPARLDLVARAAQAARKVFASLLSSGDGSDRLELSVGLRLATLSATTAWTERTLAWLSSTSRLAFGSASASWEVPLTKGGYLVGVYSTLTALRAIDAAALVASGQQALVLGTTSEGDAPPFFVRWLPGSSVADDGYNYFRPSTGAAATGNGRWERATATRTRTMTSADATPSVANIQALITAGTTTITDFDDAAEGQALIVLRGAADIAIAHDAAKIVTTDGNSVLLTEASRSAQFFHSGGVWYQVGGGGGSSTGALNAADYATIELAVAAAYAAGEDLYVPAGSYAASGNIANLHDIRTYGPGVITRSGNTFRITPTEAQVNDLYVNPATGDDANDGLTSALPFETWQRAIDVVGEYNRAAFGRWEINLAAGTYAAVDFPDMFSSNYRIDNLGAALSQSAGNVVVVRMPDATGTIAAANTYSASPSGATGTVAAYADKRAELTTATGTLALNDVITFSGGGTGTIESFSIVPTTVVVTTGSTTGVACSGASSRIVVRRVKVQGATTGNGFEVTRGALSLLDCHTEACQTGAVGITGAQLTINGGDFDGRSAGSILSGSRGFSALFNTQIAVEGGSRNTAPCFHHCEDGGLVDEGSVGHLDYSMFHDCSITGLEFTRSANQCNTSQVQLYRNAIGLKALNAPFYNNSIDFGSGTNVNTINVEMTGVGVEYDWCNDNAARVVVNYDYTNSATNTSDDTYEFYVSPTFPAWAARAGCGVSIQAKGTCTLTGNCVVTCQLENVTTSTSYNMGAVTLSSAVTAFDLTAMFSWPSASNNTRNALFVQTNTGSMLSDEDAQAGVELKNAEFRFKISVNKNAASDSFAGYIIKCEGTIV